VKAMILAAGLGSRLQPITDTVPKAMIEVGGRPLIDYALDTLERSGIHEAIVNLHHHGRAIREHLGDESRYGLSLTYSEEDPLLGSGGGILNARRMLEDGDFVTLNADTIIDLDLRKVLELHRDRSATATMVLRKDPAMQCYGLIRISPRQQVVQLLDTPARGCKAGDGEAYMYTGVQLLSPRVFNYMEGHGPFSITASTYPAMLKAGEIVMGYPFAGRWLTVGTHDELAAARCMMEG